jgi:hypothetical protein
MELFILLAIIGIINTVLKSAKRQQQTTGKPSSRGPAPEKPWQRMLGDLAETFEQEVSGKKPPIKTIPPISGAFPPPPSALREGDADDQEGYGSTASVSVVSSQSGEGSAGAQVPQAGWRGSLPGTDVSVALTANLTPQPALAEPVTVAPNGLGLTFTRDELIRAVVMNEILTRPQDRKRRWAGH